MAQFQAFYEKILDSLYLVSQALLAFNIFIKDRGI